MKPTQIVVSFVVGLVSLGVLLSPCMGAYNYSPAPANTLPSYCQIVPTSVLTAYDDVTASVGRSTIGVGETVSLALSLSEWWDWDTRTNLCSNESTQVYGGMYYPWYSIESGTGDIYSSVYVGWGDLGGSYTAWKLGVDSTVVIKANIPDDWFVTPPDTGSVDDTDVVRTLTINVRKPDLAFCTQLPYPPCNGSGKYLCLGVIRIFTLTPRNCNFDNLSFRENIPSQTVTYPSGHAESYSGSTVAFGIQTLPLGAGGSNLRGCIMDTQDIHVVRPAWLVGATGSWSWSNPTGSSFGYTHRTGEYCGPITWDHTFTFTSSSPTAGTVALTLRGNTKGPSSTLYSSCP
jgi:hypothetical protein